MILINLDLDDVLNDLSTYWMDMHHEHTGERVIPTHWNLGSLSDHGDNIYQYLEKPFFFYNCPKKIGADHLVEYLMSNSRVFKTTVVSSCYAEPKSEYFQNVYEQKKQWLADNFEYPLHENFKLVHNSKRGVPCDIIIDDYVRNLNETKRKNVVKILFEARHNQNESLKPHQEEHGGLYLRAKSHAKVVDILRNISFHGSINHYIEENR